MTPSDIREAVARAICRAYGTDPDDLTAYPAQKSWEVTTMLAWERWLDEADAALSVLIPAAVEVVRARLAAQQRVDQEPMTEAEHELLGVQKAMEAMLPKEAVDG